MPEPGDGGAPAPLSTRLTELLGIRYPIVQTGMGWVASAKLVSATANAGGLGIIASATMDLRQLAEAIAETRRRTDRPFGVNLRADAVDIAERVALLVGEGVKLASFAQAPREDLIGALHDGGYVKNEKLNYWRVAVNIILDNGERGSSS